LSLFRSTRLSRSLRGADGIILMSHILVCVVIGSRGSATFTYALS